MASCNEEFVKFHHNAFSNFRGVADYRIGNRQMKRKGDRWRDRMIIFTSNFEGGMITIMLKIYLTCDRNQFCTCIKSVCSL